MDALVAAVLLLVLLGNSAALVCVGLGLLRVARALEARPAACVPRAGVEAMPPPPPAVDIVPPAGPSPLPSESEPEPEPVPEPAYDPPELVVVEPEPFFVRDLPTWTEGPMQPEEPEPPAEPEPVVVVVPEPPQAKPRQWCPPHTWPDKPRSREYTNKQEIGIYICVRCGDRERRVEGPA